MPKGAKKRKAAKKRKEIQSNNPSNPSSASIHSQDDETKNEQRVVQIEREFKTEDESTKMDGKFEHDGNSSRSSSSGSSSSSDDDDESHAMKNSKNSSAVVDNNPVVESVKATDLLSETAAEPISTAVIEEADVSVVETPVVDEITSFVEKAQVDSVSKGSFEKIEDSIESKVGNSAEFLDAVSETKEEELVIQSVENVDAISDQKECVIQENEDRLTPSYAAEHVPANNGGESEKDSVTQPLLEQLVERSSWKSCCGLFGK